MNLMRVSSTLCLLFSRLSDFIVQNMFVCVVLRYASVNFNPTFRLHCLYQCVYPEHVLKSSISDQNPWQTAIIYILNSFLEIRH